MKYIFLLLILCTANCFALDQKDAQSKSAIGVCAMDGKISSIGAVIIIEGKNYRCTKVFKEKEVFDYVWVPIEIKENRFLIIEM